MSFLRVKSEGGERLTLLKAFFRGGISVKLSAALMGLGSIAAGQVLKGLILFALQLVFLLFMLSEGGGLYRIFMLKDLGSRVQGKEWNEALGVFEYTEGDRSQLILLYGIATLFLVILFILLWRYSVISAYKAQRRKEAGISQPTFMEDIRSLFDEKVHMLMMTPPTLALLAFTVLPLVYMMAMAFTDFSKDGNKLVLFDWVGFSNFASVFDTAGMVGSRFWSVLGWTLCWAVFATFLNFIFGTLIAIMINRSTTRLKGLWRTVLATTIAVPQFVSLLVVRSMLQPEGIVNRMLLDSGLIGERLPFLTDALWARVLVITVNLWIGIPYTILQVTGVLNNIPKEQYDAARVDGCGPAKTFFNVTAPYMMFVLTPYLITQFTGNINNFNIIYLLTRGEPMSVGSTAGATDLLITWLYKLSVDQQRYNIAAVIGIFTFVLLSAVALITYRRTGSYKNEEGFR